MTLENRVAALESKLTFALQEIVELAQIISDGANTHDSNDSRLAAGFFALIEALGDHGIDSEKLTDQVRALHPSAMAKLDQFQALWRDEDADKE